MSLNFPGSLESWPSEDHDSHATDGQTGLEGEGIGSPQSLNYTIGRAKLDPWSQGLTTWFGPLGVLLGADVGGYFTVRFLNLGEEDPPSVLGSWEIGGKQLVGDPQSEE